MRKPIIVGNWKMNKTCKETVEFIKEVEPYLHDSCTYGIAAPFTALKDATSTASKLIFAAENCHFEDSGAYTGEVSIQKVKKLIAEGITPIMCVGETEAEFDAHKTEEVIRHQVEKGLADMCPKCVSTMVIAYEPIWAIGTGKSATKEIAQNSCAIVRDQVRKMYGDEAADSIRIQYGGSVKPNNIKEYMAMEDIDGALIGGASLKVDSFKEIIDATK